MSNDAMQDRQRALENEFFARQEREKIAKLREADQARSRKQALAAASGITDDAALEQLAALEIDPRGLMALRLAPLVLVAWADGTVTAKERAAIEQAMQESGLGNEPAARELVESWLQAPPGRQLAEAWRSYARAVSAGLDEDARAALREETIGRARRIAESTSGFLGLGRRVSEVADSVLRNLDEAFAK